MSFVSATPEYVAAAATDLARIGWTITSANSMALVPTSSVLAPGADEVSASIATLFDAHSQVYQALSAQAAAFHDQFVQLMNSGAVQYLATEAANTSPLQSAATPASMAAQVPTAVGSAGGSVPGVPAAPIVSAVAPGSAIAAPQAPASPPIAAASAGPATLGPAASTAVTPARMVAPAYAPATASPATPTPAQLTSLAAAPAQVETPQAAAAPAMPVSTGTPVKMVAAHSPASAAPAGSSARPAPTVLPKVAD